MVVGLATDVFVGFGDKCRWFFWLDLVELGIENVLDAFVGVNALGTRSAIARCSSIRRSSGFTWTVIRSVRFGMFVLTYEKRLGSYAEPSIS